MFISGRFYACDVILCSLLTSKIWVTKSVSIFTIKMAGNWFVLMGATTNRDLYMDLYWIACAVLRNVRRENENDNENKTLDLQKVLLYLEIKILRCDWNILRHVTEVNSRSSLKVILGQFCWYTHCVAKTNNEQNWKFNFNLDY